MTDAKTAKVNSCLSVLPPPTLRARAPARQDESHLTVKVFTGAVAAAFHYVDDGDGYAYENGAYMKIPFCRNDTARTLTVEVNGVPCGTYTYGREALTITL